MKRRGWGGQVKRLKADYARADASALVHGNRGRTPPDAVSASVRTRVVELAQGPYAGLNHQHLTEKLAAEGLMCSIAWNGPER